METNLRLALLIDGDNAQASLLPQMLGEVRRYGTIIIRRVYGDWSGPTMNSWKEILHVHALDAAQQFSYTKGKNATDIRLIIDAMDILYTAGVDGFCIVSSDSDYTPLVTRIRQQNLFVLGIGKSITPSAFVSACDVFVHTESLQSIAEESVTAEVSAPVITTSKATETTVKNTAKPKNPKKLLQKAIESTIQVDGWANLGAVGSSLRQIEPEFDSRTYGHKQLSLLVQAYPDLIKVRKSQTSGGTEEIHVRLKAATKSPK